VETQLLAAYNLARTLGQEGKHLEWLLLEAYRGAVTRENSRAEVDFEVRECNDLGIV
jgi:hypothetical protein